MTFIIILEGLGEGRFKGRCIDLKLSEENGDVANIEGFMEGSFISFTKEYPTFYALDEEGNEVALKSVSKPLLTYIGNYDWLSKTFTGTWEILMNDERNPGGDMIVTAAGKWQMFKV